MLPDTPEKDLPNTELSAAQREAVNAISSMDIEATAGQDIDLDAIRKMGEHLRSFNKSWVKLLADKMGVEVIKIRNIIRGYTDGPEWRVAFMLRGHELLVEMVGEKKQALDVALQVTRGQIGEEIENLEGHS